MPAGNDSDNQRRQEELETQYGVGNQSAEDMIKAHDQTIDAVRQAALSKPVDAEATEAVDADSLKPRLGGEVVSYAVRGGVLVAVELTPRGTYEKWHDADYASAAKSSARQASASVGGDPAKSNGAPEGKGPNGGTTGTAGGDQGADEAPANVTSQVIQDKLAELQIDTAGATRKDQFWGLLPAEQQQALKDAASA